MPSKTSPRDGSGFPFDHFPGIILRWTGRFSSDPGDCHAAAAVAGNTAGISASLPDLRPPGTLHRSVSTHSTTKVASLTTNNETRAQSRRYVYAEHWKIGTIASELGVHPDTVRNAIESESFRNTPPLRVSIVDPYADF